MQSPSSVKVLLNLPFYIMSGTAKHFFDVIPYVASLAACQNYHHIYMSRAKRNVWIFFFFLQIKPLSLTKAKGLFTCVRLYDDFFQL